MLNHRLDGRANLLRILRRENDNTGNHANNREEQFDEAHKLCENIYTAYKEGPAKFGVAGVKYAMDLAGFFGGDPRLPLLALTDEQKSCISESFSALGKKLAIAI
jgi:dihydrodipicolinate synthase/N-acetylneuraminate lyase